jgi:hypothetical protein
MTDVAGSLSARANADDLVLHHGVDGIELVRAVERDDADLILGLVAHHRCRQVFLLCRHCNSSSRTIDRGAYFKHVATA